MTNKLLTLLNVSPSEWPRVKWMFLHSVAMGMAILFVVAATNALFLAEFGAAFYPYYYIATAISVPILVAGILRMERRLTLGAYLVLLLAVNIFLLVLLWILLRATGYAWVVFGGMIVMEASYVLLRSEY
jgi:hypothetical protein